MAKMGTGSRIDGGCMRRNQMMLRRRIKLLTTPYSTTGDVVRQLIERHPEYCRLGERKLTRLVDENSPSISSPSTRASDSRSVVSASADVICREKMELQLDTSLPEEIIELDVANNAKNTGRIEEKKERTAEDSLTMGERIKAVTNTEAEGNRKDWPLFCDIGNLGSLLEQLETEVLMPLYHSNVLNRLGVKPISGILLCGPPGCGKTKLAHAIANETGLPFFKISATDIVSGISGASEENIRQLFSKAYNNAPSVVFIDEIDAIASKRESLQREMERRIVTQLMTCMDEYTHLNSLPSDVSNAKPGYVLVIGATNRPEAIDPALRRPGRFDREIKLGVPDEDGRVGILTVLTRNCNLEGSLDLLRIARSTPGFVGADLNALVNKAGYLAMKRIFTQRKSEILNEYSTSEDIKELWKRPLSSEQMKMVCMSMTDFEEAVSMIQPSLRREGFSSIPNVKWEDVGGLNTIKSEFDRYIVCRIKCPEACHAYGVNLETGILLYGPPGCGKTLIAKAVAHEARANFIHVKGPELLTKYVGESEHAVRMLFSRARACSPCIIFFDEVDALATRRGQEGGWVVERLVNQLLIELDGAEERTHVFVVGATNRPEVIDPALLRAGRFGKLLHVPMPNSDERGLILKALAKGKPIDPSVDLIAIGMDKACENFSGADLKGLMEEAAVTAFMEATKGTNSVNCSKKTIMKAHFDLALDKMSPSVSPMQIQYYKHWSETFKVG